MKKLRILILPAVFLITSNGLMAQALTTTGQTQEDMDRQRKEFFESRNTIADDLHELDQGEEQQPTKVNRRSATNPTGKVQKVKEEKRSTHKETEASKQTSSEKKVLRRRTSTTQAVQTEE